MRSNAGATRSKRSDQRPIAVLGERLAGHRRHPHLEREHEPLGHHRRARLLALEPDGDEPGPQRPLQVRGGQRPGRREQLAHPRQVTADQPRKKGVRHVSCAGGDQQAGRAVEVDPVRGVELDRPRRARERARRLPVRAGERAREGGERAVVGGGRRLGGRGDAGAQLPRRALEQQPPAQGHRRLAGGGGQQPVQVVAREVGALGQRAPVGARLVERAEHEVDQIAEAVGHLIPFDILLDRARRRRASSRHAQLVRLRERGARARRERPAPPRRPHPQDPRHDPRGRLAAHLGHRVEDRRGRAVDRLDAGGAQGARPAARPALRPPQRLGRPAGVGRGRQARRRRRGDHRPRARPRRSTAPCTARPTCSGSTCARSPPSGSNAERTKLVIRVWTPERDVRTIERE